MSCQAETVGDVNPDTLTGVEWCEHAGIDWRRLQAELEFVMAHPERHNQRAWAERTECGTACCVAGWTVIHAGIDLRWRFTGYGSAWQTVHGDSISRKAADLLGLSDTEADGLFDEHNNLADLWRIAYAVTRGAVRRTRP